MNVKLNIFFLLKLNLKIQKKRITDNGLNALTTNCTKIEKLYIGKYLFSLSKFLKIIILRCIGLTNDSIINIANNLKDLNLFSSLGLNINSTSIHSLIEKLPDLKKIDVEGSQIRNESISLLAEKQA